METFGVALVLEKLARVASLRRSGINGNMTITIRNLTNIDVASLRRSGINGNEEPFLLIHVRCILSLLFGEVELMETVVVTLVCQMNRDVASLRRSGINGNNLNTDKLFPFRICRFSSEKWN